MYLFFNNHFYSKDHPIIQAEAKAFRYGELIFETIRCQNNHLFFFDDHFQRLTNAAALLNIQFPKYFTAAVLQKAIEELLVKNNVNTARVRVTVFKGKGGLFEDENTVFNLLIESYRLQNPLYELNSNGLDICFYDIVKKTQDIYSNYKTGNHLIYNLAAAFAKRNLCNEALLFNINNSICDSTISNIFIIKNDIIYTPPITDGCIKGILRNYLLNQCPIIEEQSISEEDLLNADEVFLTNTILGIQWVKSVQGSKYNNRLTISLFNQFIKPLNEQS